MRYPNREELVRMGLAAFAVYLGIYYWSTISRMLVALVTALTPVILGCVIAYIVNIPMSFFEQKLAKLGDGTRICRARRPLSLIIGIAISFMLAAFLLRFIMPEMMQSMRMMSQKVPVAVEAIREVFRDFDLETMVDEQLNQLSDWDKIQMQISSYLMSGAGGVMGSMVTGITSALSSTFEVMLSAILAIYIVMSKERLGEQIGKLVETYFGHEVLERAIYVGRVLDHSFSSFIIGRCISSMILGLLCIACMLLFRLPYAITIGTVVGVTNIIPVVGPFVGGIIGALLIFSTSTVDALIFVALVLVLQQIDANVVFPRVVGSSTGLPGIWVLAAVAVGGELGGIPFILLSVPIAASLYQLIGDDMRSREAKEATVAGDETPVTSIAEEPAAIAGDVDGASGDDGAAG